MNEDSMAIIQDPIPAKLRSQDERLTTQQPDDIIQQKDAGKDKGDREGKGKGSGKQEGKDKEEEEEVAPVWFCGLFRFATGFDIFLMILGSIGAAGMGAAMPAFAFIWGQMTDAFTDDNQMVIQSKGTMILFVEIGVGAFFAGWVMFACWMIAGERQAIACRKAYLQSLLKQQIGWFDMINQTELASKFSSDTFAFQGAIGEKVSTIIMTFATLISGFIFAFVTGWLMTLVVLATIPALGIAGVFYMAVIGEKDKREEASYSRAGGRAEQAISGIKTVKQLSGEDFQSLEYRKCLQEASKDSLKSAIYMGLGIGGIFFVMLASYSLGFWYGSRCILNTSNCPSDISRQKYTAGDVLVVFFSVVMAGFNLSQLTPAFKKIVEGQQAAARIYHIIDREPLIKNPVNGIRIQNLKGKIKFQNVTFAYPKEKSRKILNNLTLELDMNKTGLVGESGCGKSTIMQLIMRFYDPDEGKVTLDGHDLRDIDLLWLREQIGYVGQEPVLFATTIKENLLFGSEGASEEDINDALKKAEAYTFVQELDNKLETYVGYGGGQLSGGQKQRIAIARAILRKPKILLLDEATSALDRRNERLIQATLDKVSDGRTTVTIAHRVKTIMNSDMVYVFEKGGIKESGKFKDISMFRDYHEQKDDEQDLNDSPEGNIRLEIAEDIVGKDEKEKEVVAKQLMTKEEMDALENKKLVEKYKDAIFSRIFAYSKTKKGPFIAGIMMALANGVIFPIFSIFLSKMLVVLLSVQASVSSGMEVSQSDINEINLYALIFLLLGIAAFFLTTFQMACFNYVGEEITRQIRTDVFHKILRMPIPWFDIPKNNGGALATKLSTDCNLVNTVTTTVVSVMVQNVSTLISGIVIAFVFEWRTALVALGLLPLMILSGAIQMSLQTGFSDKTDEAYKDSSHLIMQAMINIRTVSSFGYESAVSHRYNQKMEQPYSLSISKGNLSGIFFGLSQLIMFTIFGLLFYLGALFVRDNKSADLEGMFTAVYAIVFAGMTAGNNAHFMPDTAACNNSAANLFFILDSTDEHQMQEQQKSQMKTSGIQGDIVLKDVAFKYETRKEQIFRNFNMTIKHGRKAAFVGASGCGKSTIIQLLQRFYYPSSGTITINGTDIKDFDLRYLRSCFGVVSQEPVLFNGSFKDNIKYNLEFTDEEVRAAAEKANALSFILGQEKVLEVDQDESEHAQGFDRSVGIKGSHISGGQKQRVAIARTMLRNPKNLLLDEATSALDTQNQLKVQNSLDKMMEGRTVISIAHRIETIKNADEIFMFERGEIVESGSYQQLVAKKGHFYNLERGTSFV